MVGRRVHVLAGQAKPALESGVVPTTEIRSRSSLRVRGTLGKSRNPLNPFGFLDRGERIGTMPEAQIQSKD
jgi:hypothetical protein